METMIRHWMTAALCGAALLATEVQAQVRDTSVAGRRARVLGDPAPRPAGARTATARPATQIGTPHYDVVLEVPELSVDSIGLTVADLRATLALDANAANLVSISAGADVSIQRVELEIVGVIAQAFVYVDLDNVARIVDRVITTLDNNPQILTQVLTVVDSTVGTVGGVANTLLAPGGVAENAVGAVSQTLNNVTQPGGLLTQTVNTLGQTVQVTLGTAGQIVERTLNTAGSVVNERTLGQITSLPLLRETTNAAGQTVRQVRHTSGAVLEYVVDRAGNVVSSRVLEAATGAVRP
jgi:YD repeat-containing protein